MSLLHAEYLKLSRRKLYPIMVVILLVLVAFTAFFLMLFGQIFPDLANEVPVLPKPQAYLIGAQQVASQTWFPLIMAAVLLGGEFGSTVWATSLTREPSLVRNVVARLTIFTGAGWLAYLLGTAVWALMAFIWAPGSGTVDAADWLGIAWRLGVVALVWSSLGLAAVALLRSVGPAIGAVLAFYFVDQVLGLWVRYQDFSVTAATNGLFGQILGGWLGEFIPGAGMSVGHSLTVLASWTVGAMVLTWLGLRLRDA